MPLQQIEIGVERNAAQRKYRSRTNQGKLPFEIGQAVADFFGQRFVGGRSAVADGGDVGAGEGEAVVTRAAGSLRGEAGFVEDAVQDVAGAIAGEHAAGAVGSVGAGREAEDENGRGGIAKRRDGTAPILPVAVGAALELRDFRRMPAQAGAAGAGCDLLV